jgi:hypothetical protein
LRFFFAALLCLVEAICHTPSHFQGPTISLSTPVG